MTENQESPAEQPRKGSTAPGLEGEGGQYVDGDYGEAGTSGTAREADAVREERDPLHGRRDSER